MESDINVESSTTTNNSRRTTSSPLSVNEESRRIMPTMVSLLFLITLLVPKFIDGNAEEYSSICSLEQNPIVLLQKDKWGNFMVVNTTMVNEMDSGLNGTNWSNRIDMGPSKDIFRAKECGCSDRDKIQYCLEKQGDTCGIPRDQKRPIGCFHLDSRTIFIKNAWPVVLLWYGGKKGLIFHSDSLSISTACSRNQL